MKRDTIIILIILIMVLSIVSCQTEGLSPLQSQLTQYSLKIEDLPNGWQFSDKSWEADFGGAGYTVNYELNTNIFISNTVDIYLNTDKSKLAYQQWEDLWFKSTQPWPEATYLPRDQKDDYRFECLRFPEDPILSCSYLQRHNNVTSFLKINLDNKNLTFTELNDILGILDKRLNDVGIEKKNGTPSP